MNAAIKNPPVPRGNFLFGNTFDVIGNVFDFLNKQNEQLGEVFSANTVAISIVFVHNPDMIKNILVDNHRAYIKSEGYQVLKLFLGNGLLTSEGDFWLRQRRLAQPAFHRKKIEALSEVMKEEADLLAERLEKHRGSGKAVDMAQEMMHVTMQIAARTLLGADVSKYLSVISDSIGTLNKFAQQRIVNPLLPPLWIPTPRNLKFKKIRKTLDDILLGIIAERRKNGGSHDDLLGMLMDAADEETGERMSDQQLRDEVMTLFVAGHETTAVGMSWLLHLLTENPEWYQSVRDELQIAGGVTPTASGLGPLVLTRRVIDETLRLYPPVWIVGRKNPNEEIVGAYRIPKKTQVLMCPWIVHRDARFWPEPLKFDPDRFLPGRDAGRPKFAYFPFGGGPRLCIGQQFALMEMQILTAALVQRFQFTHASSAPVEVEPLVTLRPKGGLHMFIH